MFVFCTMLHKRRKNKLIISAIRSNEFCELFANEYLLTSFPDRLVHEVSGRCCVLVCICRCNCYKVKVKI